MPLLIQAHLVPPRTTLEQPSKLWAAASCPTGVGELLCLAKEAASHTQQDIITYPAWQAALALPVTKLETDFGHLGPKIPAASSSQAPWGNHLLVEPKHPLVPCM